MKKSIAAFRGMDEKVLPMGVYNPEATCREGGVYRAHFLSLFAKRLIDIVVSFFVLTFGFPFHALIAILIKLTSQGPVFFVQDRIGQNGKPFKFYKFRTMVPSSTDDLHRHFTENFIKGKVMHGLDHPDNSRVFKITRDPRVTSMGRFLRRTSLDELPQFINVLRGEMSIVGPRPPLSYEVTHYKEWHKRRLIAKPGLTGLWQVSGRSAVPFDEMVMLDLYYIENWSLLLDLKIILRTIPVIFFGLGAY